MPGESVLPHDRVPARARVVCYPHSSDAPLVYDAKTASRTETGRIDRTIQYFHTYSVATMPWRQQNAGDYACFQVTTARVGFIMHARDPLAHAGGIIRSEDGEPYRAYSTARVSRMTVTLI